MKVFECRLTDELFSFIGDDGFTRIWNASEVARAVMEGRLEPKDRFKLDLTDELVAHVAAFNGVEAYHLPTIDEDRLQTPVMCVELPEGTHIIIDGNHRVVVAHKRGLKTLPALMFTQASIEPYEVEGLPPKVS